MIYHLEQLRLYSFKGGGVMDSVYKTDRNYEFAKLYYNWVCKCLNDDEKFEELAFFKLGVDLMIRQNELVNITFDQISFPYVNDIQIIKIKNKTSTPMYYLPKTICINTFNAIRKLNKTGKTKIFDKPAQYYVGSIIKSIGDDRFGGHMMRSLGISLFSM